MAIGNFDGMHLGHQELVRVLLHRGRAERLPAAVLTFEPHPREVFAPQAAPARLMRLREKAQWLAAAGVDELRVLRFDARFSRQDGVTFIERVLLGGLAARRIVIGQGFRFGRDRGGDVALLREIGAVRGFGVDELPAVQSGGLPVSSTRIREALAMGRLDEARTLLGRPYRMGGRVIEGRRLGRQLGFPTANIRLHRRVSPLAGIFAVRATGAGLVAHPAVASIGTRPTIGGGEQLLEVHLFGFDGDLYRQRLDVEFVARLRDEICFDNLAALTAQMHDDAREARRLLDG